MTLDEIIDGVEREVTFLFLILFSITYFIFTGKIVGYILAIQLLFLMAGLTYFTVME